MQLFVAIQAPSFNLRISALCSCPWETFFISLPRWRYLSDILFLEFLPDLVPHAAFYYLHIKLFLLHRLSLSLQKYSDCFYFWKKKKEGGREEGKEGGKKEESGCVGEREETIVACIACLPSLYPTRPPNYLSVLFVSRSLKNMPAPSLWPTHSSLPNLMFFSVSKWPIQSSPEESPWHARPSSACLPSLILPYTGWMLQIETCAVSHLYWLHAVPSCMFPQIGTLTASNVCLLKFYLG